MNLVEYGIDTSQLREITLADKPKIDSLLSLAPNLGCENCFTNLFVWRGIYLLKLLYIAEDRAVIYNGRDKCIYFPIGRIPSPRELLEIHRAFSENKLLLPDSRIYNVPPDYPEKFPEARALFDFAANPSVEPMGESNFKSVLRFMDSEDDKKHLFAEEVAIAEAFDNFRTLGLYGTVLYSEPGKIAAAAVLGPMSSTAHSVHFEKSDKLVEGASQMIVKCEAQSILEHGGKFMNREQDLGDPNLRHAKESLDPDFMYGRLGAKPRKGATA